MAFDERLQHMHGAAVVLSVVDHDGGQRILKLLDNALVMAGVVRRAPDSVIRRPFSRRLSRPLARLLLRPEHGLMMIDRDNHPMQRRGGLFRLSPAPHVRASPRRA